MKKLLLVVMTCIVSLSAFSVSAQQNKAYEDLTLNGLAAYEQLRKEYYIAALYLETFSQDSDSIMNYSGMKRMELRIVIDEWSPRRFAQHWNQAILINNDSEAQQKFADQILAFTNVPKESLITGDHITIDLDPDSGTTVYVNDSKVFHTDSADFFDVLLNTWIGARPPSSDFKRDILTLPTDPAGTALLTRYESLAPNKAREKEVAGWYQTSPASKTQKAAVATTAVAATAKAASSASSAAASTTKVTARASSSAPSKPAAPSSAPAPAAAKIDTPKPSVDVTVAQPKLASAPTPAAAAPVASQAAKPPPKPQPKPAPKPAAKPAAKPVAEKADPASAKESEQESLLKAYRSNALKLTYLNTQYPKRSMELKQQGLVVLKIRINRQGKLLDVEEEQSTEYSLLTKAARKAVSKSTPYPEVPKSLEGKEFEFTLPFNFKL